MIKHFDPFVPNWLHEKAKTQTLSPQLDWHFPGNGGYHGDIEKSCFMNLAFDIERNNYEDWNNKESLIYILDCWADANKDWFHFKGLNRCIINFYSAGQTMGWHIDHSNLDFFTLIYYVNDADGGTEFKNCEVTHKENTGLLLKANEIHTSMVSTVPRRISVAWVIAGELL
jgi:hypothetical protein